MDVILANFSRSTSYINVSPINFESSPASEETFIIFALNDLRIKEQRAPFVNNSPGSALRLSSSNNGANPRCYFSLFHSRFKRRVR